ncbi:MAG: DUF3179 domain-containing protein [Alphaproteobacteria bacterium]|nr:DUF3179 domain-containing protein [Alphaproteobacteria bacterium]
MHRGKSTALIAGLAVLAMVMSRSVSADIDAWRAAGWKTDFSKSAVSFAEILSGGPPRDGIPSIDSPIFKPAAKIADIGPNEPVIRLELQGVVRAYPLRVLTWHEIVNDTVAGRPVAVTYCPLCNSAVVFDRTVDGKPVEFGVSGLLRGSDMVMYDRATQSWWQQFSGEAIVGALTGKKLKMIPSRVESFSDYAANYPNGEVLVPSDPRIRDYGRNPYVGYDSRNAPYPFYTGDLPRQLNPMARVIVVRVGAAIHAMTLSYLRSQGEAEIHGVKLAWRPGVNSALDKGRIRDGIDVGAVTVVWAATNQPIVHDITFAFVVQSFHPDVTVLTESGPITLTPR